MTELLEGATAVPILFLNRAQCTERPATRTVFLRNLREWEDEAMLWTAGGGSELSTTVDVVGVVIVAWIVESCVSLLVTIMSEGLSCSIHLGEGIGALWRSSHWGIREGS